MISNPKSPDQKGGVDKRLPLSNSNNLRNSTPLLEPSDINNSKEMSSSSASKLQKQRRRTGGIESLESLLKESSDDIPNDRRITIDVTAMKALTDHYMDDMDGDVSSQQKNDEENLSISKTPVDRHRAVSPDSLEALLKLAATPIKDDDTTIPMENRKVVDIQALNDCFSKLSTTSPNVYSSKVDDDEEEEAIDHDAVIKSRGKRRQTIDINDMAQLMQAALSPAGDDVPPERRLLVDQDAIDDIKRQLGNSNPDAAELYESIRVAMSPAVGTETATDEEGDDSDDIKSQTPNKKRRQTLSFDSFAEILQQLSPLVEASSSSSSVASSQDVEDSSTSLKGKRDRRKTADGAWLKEMLMASPQVEDKEEEEKEEEVDTDPSSSSSKETPQSTPKSIRRSKRRMTIDADGMMDMLSKIATVSPPYVSPPLAQRTRSARKSPAPKKVSTPVVLEKTSTIKSKGSTSAKKKQSQKRNSVETSSSSEGNSDNAVDLSQKKQKSSSSSSSSSTSSPTSHPTPARPMTAPTSALKSCLSSRKESKKTSSTPGKSVLFGVSAAAEFRQSDPSSTLTPMHRDRALAYFPMTGDSDDTSSPSIDHDDDEHQDDSEEKKKFKKKRKESATKTNSRILAQWGHEDVQLDDGGEKVKSPPTRRSSGKFTVPTSLASDDSSLDDLSDDANESSQAPGSNTKPTNDDFHGGAGRSIDDSVEMDECSVGNASFRNLIESAADSPTAADDHQEEGFNDSMDMDDDDMLNASEVSENPRQPNPSSALGGDEDHTVQLEDNLGFLMDNISTSVQESGQGGGGVSNDALLREDPTVQLEDGLLSFASPFEQKKNIGKGRKQSSEKKKKKTSLSSSASSSPLVLTAAGGGGGGEDKTVDLEDMLNDLVEEVGDLSIIPRGASAVNNDDDDNSISSSLTSGGAFELSRSPHTPKLKLAPFTSPPCPASSKSSAMAASAVSSSSSSRRRSFKSPKLSTMRSGSKKEQDDGEALEKSILVADAYGELITQADKSKEVLFSSPSIKDSSSPALTASARKKQRNSTSASKSSTRRSGVGSKVLTPDMNSSNLSILNPDTPISVKKKNKRKSGIRGKKSVSNETNETPAYLTEYRELLTGIGARNPLLSDSKPDPLLSMTFNTLSNSNNDYRFVAGVELEVLDTLREDMDKNCCDKAGDMMAQKLWYQNFLKGGGAHSEPSYIEKLLRVIHSLQASSSSLSSSKVSNESEEENDAMLKEAQGVIQKIEEQAQFAWESYELELASSLEERFEQAAHVADKEVEFLRNKRNDFETLALSIDEENNAQNAAIEYLNAKEENDNISQELESLRKEVSNLDQELEDIEEENHNVSTRISNLEAIKENTLEFAALREAKEKSLLEAEEVLEDWNISSSLRSWIPRELGGDGVVIVDFPILGSSSSSDVSRLRLTIDCGLEGEYLKGINWMVMLKSSESQSSLAQPSPFTKRHRRDQSSSSSSSMLLSSNSFSIVEKLRDRLINEWIGREAGRLNIRKAAVKDLGKTLNRFDVLVGRLNLVLEEVRKIECMGLIVSFRDGYNQDDEDEEDDDTNAAGLWLQIDMSSVKFHCKVRLEVRIVDGYPWAPAEIKLIEILGAAPQKLKKTVASHARATIYNGTPIVVGADAIHAAVKQAYQNLI